MLSKVELKDFIELMSNQPVVNTTLVNIRGCNGSGKSTIPIMMMKTDPYAYEVVWRVMGKERVLATVFPSYQYLALGHYHSKCGGMDSMKNTDEIKKAVELMWGLNYNILMEGIMASTVRGTYIDLFHRLNESQEIHRDIVIYNLVPDIDTCLQRIQARNGGKPIKEEQVLRKWKIVKGNVKHFRDAGFRSLEISNVETPIEDTLDTFFSTLNDKE